MNPKQSIVKVESNIVVKGNHLLDITKQMLAPYYADLRNWWNSLDEDWKRDFIYVFKDEEDIPRELLETGKIFTRKFQSKDSTEWQILIDEKGNTQREPFDYELERIILSKSLSINYDHTDLKPLFKLKDLIQLFGDQNYYLQSLSGIENLIKLRDIGLDFSRIASIEPLRELINLESLHLYGSEISDIKALSNLIKLEVLNISRCHYLIDINPLASLINLIELDCSSLVWGGDYKKKEKRKDFNSIKYLVNLTKLFCGGNEFKDLNFLSPLTKLEYLNLNDSYFDDPSLEPLRNLSKLMRLDIKDSSINDIEPLFGITNLGFLDIDNNSVPENQIKELSKINPSCIIVIEKSKRIDGKCKFYKNSKLKTEVLRHTGGIYF